MNDNLFRAAITASETNHCARGDGSWRTIRVAEPSNLAKRHWLVRSVRHWLETLNLIAWSVGKHWLSMSAPRRRSGAQ